MDVCLLCLGSVKSFDDSIKVNSEKWKQQNIQDLINTHLWPMQCINPLSCICMECGVVLYEFHKYYKRIESAQQHFSAICKKEDENGVQDQKYFLSSESIKVNAFEKENNLEAHLFMEQPLPPDFVVDGPYIKCEKDDDLSGEDTKLTLNKKRGRPAKDIPLKTVELGEDPLKKTKPANKKRKKSKKKLLGSLEDDVSDKAEDSKLSSPTLVDIKYNESDTDPEQNVSSSEAKKKKNHRNLDEKTLKEYDKIIAENFKIFCNICQIEIDNFLSLRRHFKMEHNQRGYARCCKRNFFTRSLLVDHIHVHLDPEYFKCHQCSKVFSDRSRLLCHKKLHEDDSKLDKCEICGKLFADKGALKKHVLTHSSEKLYPCTICGKFFTNSFILNHHVEAVHQNKFVQICDICGKSIRCPTAFASHMEKHEFKSTPTSCDICGLLLTNKEGLKRHKNSQHPEGGKKEHTCHICSKVSPTQRALKSHIRSVHEQGFDFKCSLCDKSFKRPAVLREHMATHTGTALYTCLWCPRTFISNGNMYNHRKNAHPKEWEELKRQKYAGTAS